MKKVLSILIIVLIIMCNGAQVSAKTNSSSSVTSQVTSSFTAVTSANSTTVSTQNTSVSTPKSFKAIKHVDCVELRWKRDKNATGYLVSRSTDKDSWKKVGKIKSYKTKVYKDYSGEKNTIYYYSVKSYKKVGTKTYFSTATKVIPVFYGVNFYTSTYKDSVMLNWSKVNEATGYQIHFSTDGVNFKRIKRINDNGLTSYTKTKISPFNNKYYFYLKVFNMVNNKRNFIYQSDVLCSDDISSYINGSVGKPKKYFKTWNVQGKKAYVTTKTKITSADKKIFEDFNKRFAADMSPYDRIYNTFMYIHKEVIYATGSLWSKIGNSTYADAIFNKKLGQCAQYNGAMIEYLANLGFNVKLLQGYRGKSLSSKWQHFWGQVKLNNGKIYVVETGNYDSDGDWNYFFKPYSKTKKYLKCGKYVSGIK